MSRFTWGTDTLDRLAELTQSKSQISLNLVEQPHENEMLYELQVYDAFSQTPLATVELGGAEKDTPLDKAVEYYRRAGNRRDRLATILETPINGYHRGGEKIFAMLGEGNFRDADGKYISLHAELTFLKDILICAKAIGFEKVKKIGLTDMTKEKEATALEYLAQETKEEVQDLIEHVSGIYTP